MSSKLLVTPTQQSLLLSSSTSISTISIIKLSDTSGHFSCVGGGCHFDLSGGAATDVVGGNSGVNAINNNNDILSGNIIPNINRNMMIGNLNIKQSIGEKSIENVGGGGAGGISLGNGVNKNADISEQSNLINNSIIIQKNASEFSIYSRDINFDANYINNYPQNITTKDIKSEIGIVSQKLVNNSNNNNNNQITTTNAYPSAYPNNCNINKNVNIVYSNLIPTMAATDVIEQQHNYSKPKEQLLDQQQQHLRRNNNNNNNNNNNKNSSNNNNNNNNNNRRHNDDYEDDEDDFDEEDIVDGGLDYEDVDDDNRLNHHNPHQVNNDGDYDVDNDDEDYEMSQSKLNINNKKSIYQNNKKLMKKNASKCSSTIKNNEKNQPLPPDHHARRPMNAFLIFCKRHRAIVREKYPNLENRSITKILGDWWANLDENDKRCYTNLAKQYKDAFFSANPDFKWYKLPAPPLRTLSTRPSNTDRPQQFSYEQYLQLSQHQTLSNVCTDTPLSQFKPPELYRTNSNSSTDSSNSNNEIPMFEENVTTKTGGSTTSMTNLNKKNVSTLFIDKNHNDSGSEDGVNCENQNIENYNKNINDVDGDGGGDIVNDYNSKIINKSNVGMFKLADETQMGSLNSLMGNNYEQQLQQQQQSQPKLIKSTINNHFREENQEFIGKKNDLQIALGETTSFIKNIITGSTTKNYHNQDNNLLNKLQLAQKRKFINSEPHQPTKTSKFIILDKHNNRQDEFITSRQIDFEEFATLASSRLESSSAGGGGSGEIEGKLTETIDSIGGGGGGSSSWGGDELNKKSRACKGKRYQQFMRTSQFTKKSTKSYTTSSISPTITSLPITPCSLSSSSSMSTSSATSLINQHIFDTISPNKQSMPFMEIIKTQQINGIDNNSPISSTTTSNTLNTPPTMNDLKLFDATDFDLEDKIRALPALSLDKYISRKRDTKKKKKITSRRVQASSTVYLRRGGGGGSGGNNKIKFNHNNNRKNNQLVLEQQEQHELHEIASLTQLSQQQLLPQQQHKVPQTIHEAKEQIQMSKVGSQKRKARKESITRRDIAANNQTNNSSIFTTINCGDIFEQSIKTNMLTTIPTPTTAQSTSPLSPSIAIITPILTSHPTDTCGVINKTVDPTSDLLILATIAASSSSSSSTGDTNKL